MRIAVIAGDGIGPEVIAETVRVLTALGGLDCEHLPWSAEHYLRTGVTIPPDGYDTLRGFDAILVGALGDPRVPDNRHARDLLLGTRFALDLYVNYRPVRLLDARLCPLKGRTPADVNFVVCRENTEGVYVGVGGRFKPGTSDEIAVQEEIMLARLSEESTGLKAHWQLEKEAIDKIRGLKAEIEDVRAQAERAERDGDLNSAAELRYGKLVELNRALESANARLAELQSTGTMLKEEVDEQDIAEVVSKWVGIPVSKLMEGEIEKLVRMEEGLHRRVVGQDEAVSAVANAIRRSRSGLSDPNRPIGSFIFLGPTGVGKTELARALAEFLFDDERAMIRLDMSEYMEKHSVSRLYGAPPGYIGYDEGGQLTEAVRRRPYSVVLLDEIEKAHPDVFNSLLQIMDDGHMTDGQGRVVNFRNTIIIMTSNVGSDWILSEPDPERMREKVMEAVSLTFKPEFINRVDEIVVFHRLSQEHIARIVELQLEHLAKRLAGKGIFIELAEGASQYLAGKGYDPAFGARPLKRLIAKEVADRLAIELLQGSFQSGDTIEVDAEAGGLVFRKREPAPAGAMAG